LRFADADSFIRKFYMKAVPVCRRIHGDRFDSHLATRTDDAKGNLTSVSNQYFFKHDVKVKNE
jgi:hypothetical protein